MEYKEIKINLEQAKELLKTAPAFTDVIYENFPELKPRKRWLDEYKKQHHAIYLTGGFFDSEFLRFEETIRKYNSISTFMTEEQAEQHAKKLNLYTEMQVFANFRNGDWVADWSDENQEKYGIDIHKCEFRLDYYKSLSSFIFNVAVKNKKIAQEMLEEFGDRIKECFNLK